MQDLRKLLNEGDEDSEENEEEEMQKGYESEEDDSLDEPQGIKGMTL